MIMYLVPAFWPLSDLGATEIVIILIVAVVLFGSRLPQLGRSLGKGLVSFRRGINEMKDEIANAANEDASAKEKSASNAAVKKAAEDVSVYDAAAKADAEDEADVSKTEKS